MDLPISNYDRTDTRNPVSFINYLPDFFSGLWLTTVASVLSCAGAMLLGVLGALCRLSKFRIARILGAIYVEAIRNTPALVQIFMVFFGLPALGVRLPALMAGVVALSINGGAYLTEIIRAGLQAVPPGQLEAARTLGLSRSSVFFDVVFPQALRFVYPPVINEFMQLILGTSLLSTIAVNELTGVALIVNALTFETLQVFAAALAFYLILTNVVSLAASLVARMAFHPPLQLRKARREKGVLDNLRLSGGVS